LSDAKKFVGVLPFFFAPEAKLQILKFELCQINLR